jgi:hypothetical protein
MQLAGWKTGSLHHLLILGYSVMKWFAFQRGVGHKVEPVTFWDERPCSRDWERRVIAGTLCEIPADLEHASLEVLAILAAEKTL